MPNSVENIRSKMAYSDLRSKIIAITERDMPEKSIRSLYR